MVHAGANGDGSDAVPIFPLKFPIQGVWIVRITDNSLRHFYRICRCKHALHCYYSKNYGGVKDTFLHEVSPISITNNPECNAR